ncbi:hypothetical protein GOP47_0022787 [Adiantum capillus-veneris]|uniref:TFIIS N-terminal domain-containing protein n=1 Tax=Adiantum capillus-veneris TaxID=13818 RepID=A0A9D4U688_ADICA|nr:hypothetical protein GOP47_0022787 [Adiantum capillus-veneris]
MEYREATLEGLPHSCHTAMERWRVYLEKSGFDFWTICERALTLAYLDHPEDFPLRRDKLAQKLFAPEKLDPDVCEEEAPLITAIKGGGPVHGQTKINYSSDEEDPTLHSPSNGNYDEAEALTEEMEEETLLKRDVFEIKDTLLDSYKSEREILDSLQRLVFMQLSFDVLKETEIGKTVNSLRKHSSEKIRALVKKLVSEWKDTADHWYKSVEDVTAAARAEQGPDSPLDEEEDGLPSPPMDEGALLAGRTASIEMSQLFDFMDEDTSAGSGNPNRRMDACESTPSKRANGHADSIHESSKHKDRQEHLIKKKESDVRKKDRDSITSSNGYSKRDRDDNLTNGHDSRRSSIEKVERKVQRHEGIERESHTVGNHKVTASKPQLDSPELDQRLLAAKRKLQENYQQAEIAKRQRTIQVMELEDLPKGGPKRAKAPQMVRGKPLSQHRPHAFGRR